MNKSSNNISFATNRNVFYQLLILFVFSVSYPVTAETFMLRPLLRSQQDYSKVMGIGYNNDIYYRISNLCDANTDSMKKSQNEKAIHYTPKDPKLAFALGFGPGFLIHGLGHYYIGRNKTGSVLLGCEAISISCIYLGAVNGVGGQQENANSNSQSLANSLFLFSAAIFTITWIYDFSQAPKKAIQINKENQISIQFIPEMNSKLHCQISLKF